jgi:hypothetical protein
MRPAHGRVVENGNHNQSESGYKMIIRDFRKGSVDPSSPRREASLLTWPGNLMVFGPFFFGVVATGACLFRWAPVLTAY